MTAPRTARRSPPVAVIDIGSNSIKLQVARCTGGRVETLLFRRATTRIGQGLDARSRIDDDAAARTVTRVRSMVAAAKRRGASKIVVVGTHAFRAARNGRAVARRISRGAGVDVRVLSMREEAELAFLTAAAKFDRPRAVTFLIDIGGGSVEFVVARRGRVVAAKSAPLGALILTERHVHSDPVDRSEYAAMRREIDRAVARMTAPWQHVARAAAFVATGGAATTALDMARHSHRAVPASASLRLGDLRSLEVACLARTVRERRRLPGLPADRAEIMPAGLAVVISFMTHTRKRVVRVVGGGIREGLILRMSETTRNARARG